MLEVSVGLWYTGSRARGRIVGFGEGVEGYRARSQLGEGMRLVRRGWVGTEEEP